MDNQVSEKEPWGLSILRQLRPDLVTLQYSMKSADEGSLWFFEWLLTNGIKEYAFLLEDQEFHAYLKAPSPIPGLTFLQYWIYKMRDDVQATFPLPGQIKGFLEWYDLHGVVEYDLERWNADEVQRPNIGEKLSFGVNLIGYAFGQLGIGEDLRMAAHALHSARVPFTIINFPPGSDIPVGDRSIERYVDTKAPYSINIFCLTALEHARFVLTNGKSLTRERYNIGYWPWELSRWPKSWRNIFSIVDEVWASSKHTFNSIAPECQVPLKFMPMAVDLGPISDLSRENFGLPTGAHLFCFSFDLNSSMHRKNPMASVKAFQMAFPHDSRSFSKDEVGLVIKVHKPSKPNAAWDELKEIVSQDERIHIVEKTLSRPDLLALYRTCNTFISLHRAEGFGRGIAEALLLKLNVITTGYSGNVDFCAAPQTLLVRSSLIPVKQGEYPYHDDQVWADPDVDHAAERMTEVYGRKTGKSLALSSQFSVSNVGESYRLRLREIDMQLSN